MNGGPDLQGEVYQDTDAGGAILPDYYLHTTAAEDAEAKALLDAELGKTSPYRPGNTCRDFSKNQFNLIKGLGIGTPGAPPARTPVPMDWSQDFINSLQNLIYILTPAHH